MRYVVGAAVSGSQNHTVIDAGHFGTVATAQFSWPRQQSLEAGYAASTYHDLDFGVSAGEFQIGTRLDDAIVSTGTTMIRFPGGTEAWQSFNWRSDLQIEDAFGMTDYDKLRQVLEYCGERDLALSFTFPVRGFDSLSDADRIEVQRFIREELLQPAADLGVEILEIKIGNEYHVAPAMSAVQYGEIASGLTQYIGRELDRFEANGGQRPDLIIETGMLWRYGGGDVAVNVSGDGSATNNGVRDTIDIINAFSPTQAAYVDGIDLHAITLNVGLEEFYGREGGDGTRTWLALEDLYLIAREEWEEWASPESGWRDLSFHILAWSLPNNVDEGGASLMNAGFVVLQYHLFSTQNIETATSWMAANFSANSLTQPAVFGQEPTATALTAGGQIVALLSEHVTGMRAIETQGPVSNAPVEVRAFANSDRIVVYAINSGENIEHFTLEPNALIRSLGFDPHEMWVETTSIRAGDDPTSPTGEIRIREWDGRPVASQQGSGPARDLAPYEIVQYEFTVPVDRIIGTPENDELIAGAARAEIIGLDGDDHVVGSDFQDRIEAGEGEDRIRAGHGNDVVFGGSGSSHIYGGGGADRVATANSDDRVFGGWGSDRLSSQGGDDLVTGGQGRDVIHAGRGNDIVYGGAGSDRVYLGAGDDLFRGVVSGIDGAADIVRGGAGDDTIRLGEGRDAAKGGQGRDRLIGDRGSDRLFGGSGDDLIRGGAAEDELFGARGDDVIFGGWGGDVIRGGRGADIVRGGHGDDRAFLGDGADTYIDGQTRSDDRVSGGRGADIINTGAGSDIVFGQQGQDDIHGGTGRDRLYGGSGDDAIRGGRGNDFLYGGTGADLIVGGRGDDVLAGGRGSDTFIFDANSGDDTIVDLNPWFDTLVLEGIDREDMDVNATSTGFEIVHDQGTIEIQDLGLWAAERMDLQFL